MNDRAALPGDEAAERAETAAREPDVERGSHAGAGVESGGMPARAAARTGSSASVDDGGTVAGEQQVAATHLKLRRLKIHKWRNVLAGTELHFGDGIHALLGKNGSGKTTLLKLISMCVRGNFEEIRSEEFSIEYDLEFSRYRASLSVTNELGERGPADEILASLNMRDRASASPPELDYRFRIVLSGATRGPIDVEGTRTEVTLNKNPELKQKPGTMSPFSPNLLAQAGFLGIFASVTRGVLFPEAPPLGIEHSMEHDEPTAFVNATALLNANSPFRFDEADGLLHALEGSPDAGHAGIPSLEVTVVPSSDLQTRELTWIPPELRWFLMRPKGQAYPLTELTATNVDLPVLQEYVTLAGFEKVILSLALQRKIRSWQDAYIFGSCKFYIQLRNGNIISHEHLSFGQRRLLAFLYYAACNPDVIIADELTNGLHHEWIEACVDKLATRQSFVATQNPLLIDYLPVTSAKDAETAFIQCRLVEQDGKQWMSWRNTTPEEAERFWKTYETGVQFINEILRTDGLW